MRVWCGARLWRWRRRTVFPQVFEVRLEVRHDLPATALRFSFIFRPERLAKMGSARNLLQ
jgi:hypothetical protein